MEMQVTCPSGLSGRVRGFKAKEANVLADKRAMKDGSAFDVLLRNCWLETVNPGPYSWLTKGEGGSYPPVDWSKALVCDRFWALLKIRQATYGKDYVFKVSCQNKPDCKTVIEWEIDLADLPVKELPKESRAQLLEGENSFEVILPDGKKCHFKLQTGAGEKLAIAAVNKHQADGVTAALNSRIVSIEGITGPRERLAYLGELDMPQLIELVETFDSFDGGTETDIDIECPDCGLVQPVALPLGQEFFLPSRKKKS